MNGAEAVGVSLRSDWFVARVGKSVTRDLKRACAITNARVHRRKEPEHEKDVEAIRSAYDALMASARWYVSQAEAPSISPDEPMAIVEVARSGRVGWSTELKVDLMREHRVIISERGDNRGVIVCAPHHSRANAGEICSHPRVADVGAGYLAAAVAELLGATLVVAVRPAGRDPNKAGAADEVYQTEIFRRQPRLIVEIHGMGPGWWDVEIAHGRSRRAGSIALRDAVVEAKSAVLRKSGRSDEIERRATERLGDLAIGAHGADTIRFPARSNHVLTRCDELGVPAYQIETQLALRSARDLLPRLGSKFARALAAALREVHPAELTGRRATASAP